MTQMEDWLAGGDLRSDGASSEVADFVRAQPDWSDERKREYLQWSQEVVGRLEGTNACLERMFEERVRQAERLLFPEGGAGT